MAAVTRSAPAPPPELYRFLSPALFRLRWGTLALLLVITLLDPAGGRAGLPTWILLLIFAAYSALAEGLGSRPGRRALLGHAGLDLAVASGLYLLGADPNGPLFAVLLLVVIAAAARLSLRGSLVYTALAILLTAAAAPTLPQWSPAAVHDLATQMLILGLAGGGMAIVTRRLLLEQAAARSARGAATRIEELDRLRTDFIATVSHDLRTPFTAVRAGLGLVETSLDDRLRPDERQLLGNIRRNADRLDILINDLLTFNQFEAGVLHLDSAPLDLRAVIAEGIAAVHPLIQEKSQRLEVALPEPLLLAGDARRLEQMIVNLLDNAHRHTPTGTRIAIAGRATRTTIELTISDSGPGIPAAEHAAIFERFHRIAAAEGGSGLGLAIVRAIVALHGGRIWVESAPGAGAVFHVALPRTVAGEEP